jgi:tetratricopeptide (TPR) repeat protein
MTHRRTRARLLLPALVALAAGALGACAASKPFETPEPPRYSVGDQIDRAKQLASQAQAAEAQNRIDDAIRLYREAIAAYRDFPAAWHNMGLLQLQKQETLAAVESFKIAGDMDLRDPRPVYNIGVIYEQQGWTKEAQRYYTEALARDANYLDALRRAVYIDMTESTYTPATLERTRRALMVEQDPKWRGFFERSQLRLDDVLTRPKEDAGVSIPPDASTPPRR